MLQLSQGDRDKIRPAELSFIILNHLNTFDTKPDQINLIIEKFEKLKDHVLYTHSLYYQKAYEYYNVHQKFPDIEWLTCALPNMAIKKQQGNYSYSIYEDFIAVLDKEGVKKLIEKLVVENNNLTSDEVSLSIKALTAYNNKNATVKKIDKEAWLNTFDEYSKNYKGVKTYIKQIDDIIGVLGYKSISVFGAPSGSGKSTLATTLAYNAAVFGGLCVDYITFEIPEDHMRFNLASIESTYMEGYEDCPSSNWKQIAAATDEEKAILSKRYRECSESLMAKLNDTGGFINPIDYSRLKSYSYEEFCARLETEAENREGGARKADLVVIDNIDGFSIFKSTEKDAIKKVDSMIRSLDEFSKTYYNGEGTHFLLLTQTNREGILTLKNAAGEESDTDAKGKKKKKAEPDMRCISTYNALYEKAAIVLLGYSVQGINRLNLYPVKMRNMGTEIKCIKLSTDFPHSKICGENVNEASSEDYKAYLASKEAELKAMEESGHSEDDDFNSEDN